MDPFDGNRPCTVQELDNIITGPCGGITMMPSNAFDEVFENVFIGEGDSALRINCMKRLGVTHVLNAALGKDKYHVNSNHVMYKKAGIEFFGVEATDFINCDLTHHFDTAADFIESGLKDGGKIFAHCVQGVSRSATLVIAYLIIKKHMQVQDALRMVREKREICPNDGFLQQLCDLNEKLKKAGHFERDAKCESKKQDEDIVEDFSAAEHKMGELKLGSNVKKHTDENDTSCTVENLESILTAPSNGLMLMAGTSHSRINENIFIGNGTIATNTIGLKTLGVTHVLNAAHNKGVVIDGKKYQEEGLEYMGLALEDTLTFDLTPYFESAADFIHSVTAQHGQVLVNCVQGVSRSASLVVAYFMIKHRMTVQSALRLVREKREVCPNSSFLQQLCDLNNKLQQSTHL